MGMFTWNDSSCQCYQGITYKVTYRVQEVACALLSASY